MSYGAKILTIGVAVKAVVMSAIVTVLAATAFWQSLILVIVSAVATGAFAVLIVVMQAHFERSLHIRLDELERQTKQQTKTIVDSVAPESPAGSQPA